MTGKPASGSFAGSSGLALLYTLAKFTKDDAISLSDARKRLSDILREIEADPGAGYRILVRNRVVAELRSPAPVRRKNPGATMLKLALEMEKLSLPARGTADEATAANYQEDLSGSKPVSPRRRR
jgi:antitoxin (DNA-binding transcriptional repressor) of toxin-antitoxin stability system